MDADYFYSYQSVVSGNPDQALGLDRRKSGDLRDGRYRSIDPLSSLSALKAPPPHLSHNKHRLPNRADVGFPNPSPEDVTLKQNEIHHETIWEESSPRLALLVTSDDLGTAVEPETTSASLSPLYNVCQDMPYAGQPLTLAKVRNARHFGKRLVDPGGELETLLLPNPFSMLAPPLESSYSPSQGWRPRPFHDRPAGMQYCVAWPLELTLERPSQEKLLYSLTLYTLPPRYKDRSHLETAASAAAHHCKKQGLTSSPAFGKISEECWFPNGNWSDQITNSNTEPELLQSWMDQKHKAIFSYDPSYLMMEDNKRTSRGIPAFPDSLYVVLQVYKLLHAESNESAGSAMPKVHSPIAFGITKFFSASNGEDVDWPNGQTQQFELYAYPDAPISQGSFVERLWCFLHHKSNATAALDDSSSSTIGDDLSLLSIRSGDLAHAASKKTNLTTRLFRSPKRSRTPPPRLGKEHRRSASASSAASKSRHPSSRLVFGSAKMFLASLRADFLQAMLNDPPEMKDTVSKLPRQLVDVSGDFAILLDRGRHADATNGKRSNLSRLPVPTEAAGYAASAEFREVLFLPARADKHYDVDYHMSSSRAFLNLLYLYPRLLRASPNMSKKEVHSFTLRVRILHSDAIVDNATSNSRPIRCLHNLMPWSGDALLDTRFTKVVGDVEHDAVADIEVGLPMQDEIKIRLPEVLDSNYRFEFTLFTVEHANESSVKLSLISEATVPLTSAISPRVAPHGLRAATIIPNGKHRLELGDYQLHLETRLVSSIHTGDPSVAVALSEWSNMAVPNVENGDGRIERLNSSFSLPERGSLVSTASEGTLVAFFQVLVYMHLLNLIEPARDTSCDLRSPRSVYALLDLLDKVKSKLLAMPPSLQNGANYFHLFTKRFVDMFDEACLVASFQPASDGEMEEDAVGTAVPAQLNDVLLQQEVASGPDVAGERSPEGHFRFNRRLRRKKQLDLNLSETPFSRVAFGATKSDRMRAEAELKHASRHWAPFFDDDETIATAPTFHSGSQWTETRRAFAVDTSPERITTRKAVASGYQDIRSIDVSESEAVPFASEGKRSISEIEFVQRVRNAATVMLAPCVAPSLSRTAGSSPVNGTKKLKPSFLTSDTDIGRVSAMGRKVQRLLRR
jgi:hypothetical protein